MTAVRVSKRAEADIARLTGFLREEFPAAAAETFELIVSAIDLLADHPLLGRPVEHEQRELVISRGRSGYLALYDYNVAADTVVILAIRHQREVGYTDPNEP